MNPVSPVLPNQEHRETTFAKDQPQYLPLPAIVMHGPEKEVLTRWELTDEEKIALLSGGQIYLSVWTFGHPLQPIKLRIAHPEEIAEEYGLVQKPWTKEEISRAKTFVTNTGSSPSYVSPAGAQQPINSIEPIDPEVEKALDEKFPEGCEYEH